MAAGFENRGSDEIVGCQEKSRRRDHIAVVAAASGGTRGEAVAGGVVLGSSKLLCWMDHRACAHLVADTPVVVVVDVVVVEREVGVVEKSPRPSLGKNPPWPLLVGPASLPSPHCPRDDSILNLDCLDYRSQQTVDVDVVVAVAVVAEVE